MGVDTIDGWITPACTLLMSRRLPTRLVRRSVSESIVVTNSAVSCSDQVTSRFFRLVAHALIDASGVRRSCDTACNSAPRQFVGIGQSVRPSCLDTQPTVLEHGCQLVGEGVEDQQILGRNARPVERQHDVGAQLLHRLSVVRPR